MSNFKSMALLITLTHLLWFQSNFAADASSCPSGQCAAATQNDTRQPAAEQTNNADDNDDDDDENGEGDKTREPTGQQQEERNDKLTAYAIQSYLKHTEGRGLGYNIGYTTLGIFSTTASPTIFRVHPFVDFKAHIFNNGRFAGNIGAGARFLIPKWEKVMGVNAFYDFRRTHDSYHQVGLGAELFGNFYDVVINGYFPIGHKTHSFNRVRYNSIVGLFQCVNHEQHLGGADGEVSTSYSKWFPGSCSKFDVYAGVGPYYYSRHSGKNVMGGRLRIGATYGSIFTVEIKATEDAVFHGRVQGIIAINFPLWLPSMDPQDEPVFENPFMAYLKSMATYPVERNEIITTDNRRKCKF